MDDEDPDLSDDVAAIIHRITKDDSIIVHDFVLVASYSAVEEEFPPLFTWWGDSPKWKLLGMAEGLSEMLRIQLRKNYEE